MIIWLMGLSGSGKSTLGNEIYKQIKFKKPNVILLDGDDVRKVFEHDKGDDSYSIKEREKSSYRLASLCLLLDKQGVDVICCNLSSPQKLRNENRKIFSSYFEIFMDSPIEVLIERDKKGLYKKFFEKKAKNVVGLDLPFLKPENPDLIINSSKKFFNISEIAKNVIKVSKIL